MSGAANMAQMEMKKGKANVPPQMRGQYARQQEMQSMREDMEAASKPGKDGLPVFNLFVRTPRANMVRRASKPFSLLEFRILSVLLFSRTTIWNFEILTFT